MHPKYTSLQNHRSTPKTDMDGNGLTPPLNLWAAIPFVVLAALPLLAALTRPLWERPTPGMLVIEQQMTRDREAIRELIRINEYNRSQIAAMQAAQSKKVKK